MKTHNIPLESLIPKSLCRNGDTDKVLLKIEKENGELQMHTLVEGLSKKHQNYAYITDKLKLPFRIDITLKTNSPAFKFRIGKGHILFGGSSYSRFGISHKDILSGTTDTVKYDCDNILPINEYVDLSVIYGNKKTWVEFNGQPCYYTGKAPYLKLLAENAVPDVFKDGLDFAIVCGGDVELRIKSLMFSEYEDREAIPVEIENLPELSAFEWYLKSLPHEVRDEAVKTDEYLMKDMKTSLKFKKSIDGDGKLYYDSPCGLQYSMQRYGIGESHFMFWNKERVSNLGTVLNKLAESSPEFADRLFAGISEHLGGRGGCKQCASIDCWSMKSIEYNGEIKRACKGAISFKWLQSEFEDVRKVIAAVNDVVKMGG
jgi:hypothetical protein